MNDGCWLVEELPRGFLYGPFWSMEAAERIGLDSFKHFQVRKVWPAPPMHQNEEVPVR